MYRFSVRTLAACGLVLGSLCAVQEGNGQQPNDPSLAPPEAAPAPYADGRGYGGRGSRTDARRGGRPEIQSESTAENVMRNGNGKTGAPSELPLGRFSAPQPAVGGPLVALKSGPEHARIICRLQWMPTADVRTTISELLRQEAEMSGSTGTATKAGPSMRVAIVSEPVTNSLLVSGSPDAVEEVRKLAEALDQPQPRAEFEIELGEVAAGEVKHGESLKSEGSAPPAETANTFYVLERPKTMKTIARARIFTLDNQAATIRAWQQGGGDDRQRQQDGRRLQSGYRAKTVLLVYLPKCGNECRLNG